MITTRRAGSFEEKKSEINEIHCQEPRKDHQRAICPRFKVVRFPRTNSSPKYEEARRNAGEEMKLMKNKLRHAICAVKIPERGVAMGCVVVRIYAQR